MIQDDSINIVDLTLEQNGTKPLKLDYWCNHLHLTPAILPTICRFVSRVEEVISDWKLIGSSAKKSPSAKVLVLFVFQI